MANANFTPTKGAYTELKPFRFWCQKVLPLVYDDSLSYYELLCKVVDYLNKTMEDVDTLNTDVTNLFAAYDQLQDWVNAYYESADFEAAIDAGLDRMAEDGRLDALMTPLIDSHLPELVYNLLPDTVSTLLPDEVSNQIGPAVQTQLPGVVSNQIGPTVQTQLPGVVSNQIGGTVANQLPAVVSNQIGPVVEEKIVDPVEDWLETNVSGGSAVDRTLSILGAGADAAFTGARLEALDNVVGYEHVADTGSFITTANPFAFNYEVINDSGIFSDQGTHTYKMLVIPVNTGDKYCINAHKISIAGITENHFAVTYAFCAKHIGDPDTDTPYYLPTIYGTDDADNLIVTAPEINIPTGQYYDETTGYLVVITADIQDPVYKVNDAVIPALEERIDDVEDSIEDLADTVEEDLANKANIDGYYSGLTAGAAEQLVSDQEVTDNIPYLIRRTGGSKAVGNREYDEIVGGSVVWNQLEDLSSGNVNGITYSKNANRSITVSGTANDTSSKQLVNSGLLKIGHKILILRNIEGEYPTIQTNAANLRISYIHTVVEGDYVRLRVPSGTTLDITIYVNVFDLTAMFGATIADYAYTLDQSTAGSGIAWLKSYGFFANDYIPYNAGTLEHVSGLSAHVMRDGDNNVIGNYPLDSSLILRGIPKLADGQMYYDGDVYAHDGTVTRNYNSVTLNGSETWTEYMVSDVKWFFASVLPDLASDTLANPIPVVSDVYNYAGTVIQSSHLSGSTFSGDKIVAVQPVHNRLWVKDTSKADVTALKTALASNPLTIVYKNATPTTETATAYQSPQICDPGGTEEYTGSTIPVGHNTQYPADLKGKLERLPDSAPADGTYLIQQTNDQMTLIPAINALPAAPAADGTYTLKATVTDGNISYFWEVTT